MVQFAINALPGGEGEEVEQSWGQLNDGKLYFIDVHHSWCGPCEVIHPTLQRLAVETPEWEQRMGFYSADIISPKLKDLFAPEEAGVLDNRGCKPMFLLVREGAVKARVDGADAPAILRHAANLLPKLPGEVDEE